MKQLWSKTAAVAVATLLVGMALGYGINAMTDGRASEPTAKERENRSTAAATVRDEEWNPFREMERMQQEIDRAIQRATEQFRMAPNVALAQRDLGFSSKLDLRDRRDHFEIRAWMPDAEAADVNVTTEGDNLLRVAVSHRRQDAKESGDSASRTVELGRYEQVVTLPEPVKTDELKVERKDRELVITVPKARAS
jgi:HSP20 family molecular chaperone IbpA